MSVGNDFYGDGQKWFIGVVKNTRDPMNSNRVQVRIKGIHPDEGDSDTGSPSTPPTSGSGTTTGASSSSSTPSTNTGSAVNNAPAVPPSPGIQKWSQDKIPTPAQFNMKISRHFTLNDLTSSESALRGRAAGALTQSVVNNLNALALNVLDPLKDNFHNLSIHCAFRWKYSKADNGSSGGNHPKGYAADISVPGMSLEQVRNWIQTNLKGKFNMALIGKGHVHVQLGGSSNQGTTSNPVIGHE